MLSGIVMTYSDAGQFEYLKNLIDEIYTVETPEQILSMRKFMTYKDGEGDSQVVKSIFDGMSDEDIVKY